MNTVTDSSQSNIKTINNPRLGFLAALLAFFLWGHLALYWKALEHIPATEILAHRVIWSMIFLIPIIYFAKCIPEILQAFRQPKLFFRIAISGLIIGFNWGLYIYYVNAGHILETSLGYFINPLVNVLLARIFLKEKLTGIQLIAIALVIIGISFSLFTYGRIPWIALTLAFSFSLYGLLRKTVNIGSISGLFLETLIISPIAIIWLIWQANLGNTHFLEYSLNTKLLLMGTGIISCIPLILFAFAAKQIRLSTLGLVQYLSPSISFFIGVFVFSERLSPTTLLTFTCIWIALAIYSWGSIREAKKLQKITQNK